ncbi:MAG: hypothetical protein WC868_06705 [Bacteroidales bacterium]
MKKLKNFCMMITAIILLSQTRAMAQREKDFENKKEKIEAQKVAFITTKLNLTTEESKNFWPVYNEYETKKEALRKNFKKTYKFIPPDSLTETQAKERITAELKMEQSLLDLKEEYTTKFLNVLPASKVLKLIKTEAEFKRILLKMLKETSEKPQK